MSFIVSKGNISTTLTADNVLEYLGLDSKTLALATQFALSRLNEYDSASIEIDYRCVVGHEEKVTNLVLSELREIILKNFNLNNNELDSEDDEDEIGVYYRVFADDEFVEEFPNLYVAQNFAVGILHSIDADNVSVIDTNGRTCFSTI